MIKLLKLLAVSFVLLTSACAIVSDKGTYIPEESLKFIRKGKTTKDEVIARLGKPDNVIGGIEDRESLQWTFVKTTSRQFSMKGTETADRSVTIMFVHGVVESVQQSGSGDLNLGSAPVKGSGFRYEY